MEISNRHSTSSIDHALFCEFEKLLNADSQDHEKLYTLALKIFQIHGHNEKRLLEDNTREKKQKIIDLAKDIKARTTDWKQAALGYTTAVLQAGAGIGGVFSAPETASKAAKVIVKIVEGAGGFGQASSQMLSNHIQGNVGEQSTQINMRMQEMDTLSQKKAENTPSQTNQQIQEAQRRASDERKAVLDSR